MTGWPKPDALEPVGATLALEAQNAKETNLLTTLSDAAALSLAINRPNVRVVADTYHLHEAREAFDVVAASVSEIAHVHVSDSDRQLPGEGDYDFATFFETLASHHYRQGLSIEMMREVTDDEMLRALAFVRDAVPPG